MTSRQPRLDYDSLLEHRERKLKDAEFEQARVHGRAPDMRWHLKRRDSRLG